MRRARTILGTGLIVLALLALPGCFPKRSALRTPKAPAPVETTAPAQNPEGLETQSGAGEPVYYTVRRGDNLYQISKRYGLTVRQLAEANRLKNPRKLSIGQRLLIPGLTRDPLDPGSGSPVDGTGLAQGSGDGSWSWPLLGKISSGFGPRRRRHHSGIDILSASGTLIRSTQDGVVTFAGRRGRYGNLVILQHPDGFSSYYGHNRKNLVKTGQQVNRGEVIAEVGRTGNASASHLHFEIRHDGRAINPLALLPGEAAARLESPPAEKGAS